MNKQKSLIVLAILSIGLLIFIVCWYNSSNGLVNVSKDYVNNLDISKSIPNFQKDNSGLKEDQICGILMSIGVLSNLRYSDFDIKDEVEKKIKADDKCKKEELDSFNLSLSNFLFSKSDGVSFILQSDDKYLRHVKQFLEMFVTSDTFYKVSEDFYKYLTNYEKVIETAYKKYSEEVVNFLKETKILTESRDIKKSLSVGEVVWGMFLMFYKKNTNLKIIN